MSDQFHVHLMQLSEQAKSAVTCLLKDCIDVSQNRDLQQHRYREHLVPHLKTIEDAKHRVQIMLEQSGRSHDPPPTLDISALEDVRGESDIQATWKWVMSTDIQEAIQSSVRYVDSAVQEVLMGPKANQERQANAFYGSYKQPVFQPKAFHFYNDFWNFFNLYGTVTQVNDSRTQTQYAISWDNRQPSFYETGLVMDSLQPGDPVHGIFAHKNDSTQGNHQLLFAHTRRVYYVIPEFWDAWPQSFRDSVKPREIFRWYLNLHYSGCRFSGDPHKEALKLAIQRATEATVHSHNRANNGWLGKWQPKQAWLAPDVI